MTPDRPRAGPSALAAGGATATVLALLLGGLILVRWVSDTLTAPGPQTLEASLEDPAAGRAPPFDHLPAQDGASVPSEAIRDEAFRLAAEALATDDLEAARDLYILAAEAVPGDQKALELRRQVEMAIAMSGASNAALSPTRTPAPVRTATPPSASPTGSTAPGTPGGLALPSTPPPMDQPARGGGQRPAVVREPLEVMLHTSCTPTGGIADRRLVRASGLVSYAGTPLTDFEVAATIRGASGEVVASATRAYRGPSFSFEEPVSARGPLVLALVVSARGLPTGGSVARVTC